jgi:hypothetical protein
MPQSSELPVAGNSAWNLDPPFRVLFGSIGTDCGPGRNRWRDIL